MQASQLTAITASTATDPESDVPTGEWWPTPADASTAAQDCRAWRTAHDYARAIADAHATIARFTDYLNAHLAETGVSLPIRVGGVELVDDGDGGFAIKRIKI